MYIDERRVRMRGVLRTSGLDVVLAPFFAARRSPSFHNRSITFALGRPWASCCSAVWGVSRRRRWSKRRTAGPPATRQRPHQRALPSFPSSAPLHTARTERSAASADRALSAFARVVHRLPPGCRKPAASLHFLLRFLAPRRRAHS